MSELWFQRHLKFRSRVCYKISIFFFFISIASRVKVGRQLHCGGLWKNRTIARTFSRSLTKAVHNAHSWAYDFIETNKKGDQLSSLWCQQSVCADVCGFCRNVSTCGFLTPHCVGRVVARKPCVNTLTNLLFPLR